MVIRYIQITVMHSYFATDFEVTSSSYIRNVTVITQGKTTSGSDPRGFLSGDAGKGAYVDGLMQLLVLKKQVCCFIVQHLLHQV